jgi:hypothetical protein
MAPGLHHCHHKSLSLHHIIYRSVQNVSWQPVSLRFILILFSIYCNLPCDLSTFLVLLQKWFRYILFPPCVPYIPPPCDLITLRIILCEVSQEIPHIFWNQKIHQHVHHWSPASVRWIQSTPSHPTGLRSILILFSFLHLVFQAVSFLYSVPPMPLRYATCMTSQHVIIILVHSLQFSDLPPGCTCCNKVNF